MADVKTNAIVRLLAGHGEKIALGAASLLLAGYLGVSIAFSGQNPRALELEGVAKRIGDQMRQEHKDLAPGRASSLATPTLQINSPNTPPIAGDPWACSYRTDPVFMEKGF